MIPLQAFNMIPVVLEGCDLEDPNTQQSGTRALGSGRCNMEIPVMIIFTSISMQRISISKWHRGPCFWNPCRLTVWRMLIDLKIMFLAS